MNYVQLALFVVSSCSILVAGIAIYSFIGWSDAVILNRIICLGELLLLGSVVLVGEMLLLSLLGLYKALYLWGAVLFNFLALSSKMTRCKFSRILLRKIEPNIPLFIFCTLLFIFIFRNCYFMVDVDSHSTYLFAQKLWLSAGSSLVGGPDTDVRVFSPHFDAVPYSLGLSIFGGETLFPELVTVLWRIIVLLLVYGYASYRFDGYYGLAASMFVLFNEHFFYSGANQWVIINAALIGFLFAAAYNFWESRRQRNPFYFILALIFMSQLLSNKYQMVYVAIFMLILGSFIQVSPTEYFRQVVQNKKWTVVLLGAWLIMGLWYIKNLIVVGDPSFPVLAGKFKVFGWGYDQWKVFVKLHGGLNLTRVLKYLNYLFIWPGIAAAKYVIMAITALPLIFLVAFLRSKPTDKVISELCYWLILSILTIIGICLANHQDPRYYRYAIAIMAFTAVVAISFLFNYCVCLRWKRLTAGIIISAALLGGFNEGYKVIFLKGGDFKYPSPHDNLGVIMDKLHMKDLITRHYPDTEILLQELKKYPEKMEKAAWDHTSLSKLSAFLLPVKSVLSMWYTSVIGWESYKRADLIVKDLSDWGIDWIIRFQDGELTFVSADEYARDAVQFDQRPKKVLYDYGFPSELSRLIY